MLISFLFHFTFTCMSMTYMLLLLFLFLLTLPNSHAPVYIAFLFSVFYVGKSILNCNLPLHFWQNGQDFSRATMVTRRWNRHRNKSQHRHLALGKEFLPSFLPGHEPKTFQSRVRRPTTELHRSKVQRLSKVQCIKGVAIIRGAVY